MAETGGAPSWDTCPVDACAGARLQPGGACLVHLPPEELRRHLGADLGPVDLDGRGVRFTCGSLAALFDALGGLNVRRLGTVRFDGAIFEQPVDFDDTTFAGPASFVGVTFSGNARFGNATFASEALFDGATFAGQAWFVGADFRGAASFAHARFSEPSWFQRTVFGSSASFDDAAFMASATFTSSTFPAATSFLRVSFCADTRFDRASLPAGEIWKGASFRLAEEAPASTGPPQPSLAAIAPAHPTVRASPRRRHRLRQRRPGLAPVLAVVFAGAAAWVILRPMAGPSARSADAVSATGSGPIDSERAYNFLRTDAIGRPTRYNPCQPIGYVVNPDGAPTGWEAVIASSMSELSTATGMSFADLGMTREAVTPDRDAPGTGPQASQQASSQAYQRLFSRASHQPARYPGRWAPLLITWTDLADTGGPAGELGGVGGSDPRKNDDGGVVYVSGTVAISKKVPVELLKVTLLHELGHAVGLAHVDNRVQIMYSALLPETTATWGAGDRKGLDLVGRSAGCLPVPEPS